MSDKIKAKLKKLLRGVLLFWVLIGFISIVIWLLTGIAIVVNYIISTAMRL